MSLWCPGQLPVLENLLDQSGQVLVRRWEVHHGRIGQLALNLMEKRLSVLGKRDTARVLDKDIQCVGPRILQRLQDFWLERMK